MSGTESPLLFEDQCFSADVLPNLAEEAVFVGCRFSSLSFHERQFRNIRFRECHFEDVTFVACAVQGGDWSNCQFDRVHWRDGSIADSRLHEGRLQQCSWTAVALNGFTFSKVRASVLAFRTCKGRYASLVASDINDVIIEKCHLTDVSWIRGTIALLKMHDSSLINFIFGQTESQTVLMSACEGRNVRWIQSQSVGTRVTECQFLQCAWSHSTLKSCVFENSRLATAGFEHSAWEDCVMKNMALQCAHFDSARLSQCAFQSIDAPGMSLRGGRVERSSFSDANLSGIDARGAMLTDVRFDKTYCTDGRMNGQPKHAWHGADLRGAQFADTVSKEEVTWYERSKAGVRPQDETP